MEIPEHNKLPNNMPKSIWKNPTVLAAVIAAIGAIAVALIQFKQSNEKKEQEFCYPITIIDKSTSKPAMFNTSKAQLTIDRNGKTQLVPLTQSSGNYCTLEALNTSEKVFITLDNADYQIIVRDLKLILNTTNEVYVEKKKR